MPRYAFLASAHQFRRAGYHDVASAVASVGAHVDDIVGAFYYVKVVLDYDYGVPAVNQSVESAEQAFDVVEVKSRGGFVEYEHRGLLFFHADEVGQFHSLVFSSRQRR